MDAPLMRRSDPRPPSRRLRARVGVAVLLLAAAGFVGAESPHFGLRAVVQPKPAAPSGGGFELHAKLTPASHALQGSGYSVDAVAAPAASCDGDDTIFANGFEAAM